MLVSLIVTLFSDKMLISHTWFDAQLNQKIFGRYLQPMPAQANLPRLGIFWW